MMYGFILGVLLGFLSSLLITKHVIKKNGAGQMKICSGCSYRAKEKKQVHAQVQGEDEKNQDTSDSSND